MHDPPDGGGQAKKFAKVAQGSVGSASALTPARTRPHTQHESTRDYGTAQSMRDDGDSDYSDSEQPPGSEMKESTAQGCVDAVQEQLDDSAHSTPILDAAAASKATETEAGPMADEDDDVSSETEKRNEDTGTPLDDGKHISADDDAVVYLNRIKKSGIGGKRMSDSEVWKEMKTFFPGMECTAKAVKGKSIRISNFKNQHDIELLEPLEWNKPQGKKGTPFGGCEFVRVTTEGPLAATKSDVCYLFTPVFQRRN